MHSLLLLLLATLTTSQHTPAAGDPAVIASNPHTTLSTHPTTSPTPLNPANGIPLPQQILQFDSILNASSPSTSYLSTTNTNTLLHNSDFSAGDLTSWTVESPAKPGVWSADVRQRRGGDTQENVLVVTVPGDSYVMMYQDVQNTLAGTRYTLSFDYAFHSHCGVGASVYFGVVSAEDLVDLEGDLLVDEEGWKRLEKSFVASTDGMSLYLYFMTGKNGACGFEVGDVEVVRERVVG